MEDTPEATVGDESFNLAVEFVTLNRRATLVGTFRQTCDRRPKTVVVTLVQGDTQYDRIAFDFPKDFRLEGGRYRRPSEVVLNGAP